MYSVSGPLPRERQTENCWASLVKGFTLVNVVLVDDVPPRTVLSAVVAKVSRMMRSAVSSAKYMCSIARSAAAPGWWVANDALVPNPSTFPVDPVPAMTCTVVPSHM